LREGEKRAWRWPSPGAGESGGALANFDERRWFSELGGNETEAVEDEGVVSMLRGGGELAGKKSG
jgi:hypothetical protein